MDEMIQLICDKTGLSAEQARGAADTVVGFLKDKLPSGMGEQLDSLINGGSLGSLGDLAQNLPGGLGDKIGGMLGS